MLFRVLFLEVWANLSDVQVCRELRYNVLYRHFCGIGWGDPIPDDTTLVVFRRRLGEETFRRLFTRVVEQAKEKGLIRGKWAIIDGTKVIAHAAVKNNVALAREGRRKLLSVLARHDAKRAKELEVLAEPERDMDYADHEQLLAAELLKGQELISRLEDRKEKDVVEVRELYRKVVQLEGVASLSDPDARWGFKKKGDPFLGYKAHVACDETGIATAVTVTPGNESELPQLPTLVEEIKQEGIEPIYLAADKGYDDADKRRELEQSGIRAYMPSRNDLSRLEKQGFAYDRKRQVLTCAAGKCSIGHSVHRKGGFIYYFSERDCMGCQYRSSCLGESQAPKLVYVKPEVYEHRARGLKRAMKVRKTIERLFGEVKTWHRMARARYRGLEKVAIQVIMTLIVANVKKMAKWLASREVVCPQTG
ncbi:MAG TPA: IS1182 family transposase [Firmicutes bacterium]|nr:IS1182 family transposase [Bacillota bacterium]